MYCFSRSTYQQSQAWMTTAWPHTFPSMVTGLPHEDFAVSTKEKIDISEGERMGDDCPALTALP